MKIKSEIREAVIAHALSDTPLEACGYLGEKNGLIVAHYPMENIDKSGEHFSFDPEEQFAVVKGMRRDSIRAKVVYHSHPETPARPSEEDIRLAYDPNVIHLICSLAGEAPDLKAFHIAGGKVNIEPIEIVD